MVMESAQMHSGRLEAAGVLQILTPWCVLVSLKGKAELLHVSSRVCVHPGSDVWGGNS